MSLRFLADQCVPLQIVFSLRQNSHDVIILRDVLPVRSVDPIVIAKAQELNRILLSLNGDFSDIVAYPPANYQGIVAIQLHNHPEIIPDLMDRLNAFLAIHPDPKDFVGRLIIAEVHRIRVRN